MSDGKDWSVARTAETAEQKQVVAEYIKARDESHAARNNPDISLGLEKLSNSWETLTRIIYVMGRDEEGSAWGDRAAEYHRCNLLEDKEKEKEDE